MDYTDQLDALSPSDPPTVGRTWEVRPELLVASTAPDEATLHAVRTWIRDQGWQAWIGWTAESARTACALHATLGLDADSAGAAVDYAVRMLSEAATACGVHVAGLGEVVVVPGWRDEREQFAQDSSTNHY